jgi:hypothetical protein
MTATTAPTSDLEITDHGSGLRGPLLGVNGHERRGADDPRPDHHARLGILNHAPREDYRNALGLPVRSEAAMTDLDDEIGHLTTNEAGLYRLARDVQESVLACAHATFTNDPNRLTIELNILQRRTNALAKLTADAIKRLQTIDPG